MSTTPCPSLVSYIILLCLCLVSPAAAFGAGNIPTSSGLFGFNGRHGDIATMLLSVSLTAATASAKMKNLDMKRVYFGNWLRDYSQIMDVKPLKLIPEEVLRAIVSILGFMEFGFATREFDITRARLGVYRQEEHIDNPTGFSSEARAVDSRLRGPVDPIELEIDLNTGMKNYIANEAVTTTTGQRIATSSAYIRQELELAIKEGRQGKNDENRKYEAFRHLGAALHTLEDFSAHSNYVELCLLLHGKRNPEKSLDQVFAYIGDKTHIQTRAGPAPPLVTGSFGPLDIVESLLGEVDDKMVTGKLSELSQRLPRGGDVSSAVAALQTALNTGKILGLQLPGDLSQKVESLKSSPASKSDQGSTWEEVNRNPSGIWDAIEPFFRVRDDLVKWLQETAPDLGIFTEAVAKISAEIDKMVFAALASVVGPILGDVRQQLEIEKEQLLKEEKASLKNPENDIFSLSDKATNPSHSQISKDHFDSVLNIPAAQVAALVTAIATSEVISCWNDPSIDANQAIANILKALHHPFYIDFNNPNKLQKSMFDIVTRWWDDKSPDQQNTLRDLLKKSTIESGRNKFLILNPEEWHNQRTFGKRPEEEKSLVDSLIDNITDAVKKGVVDISQPVLDQITNTIQAIPTPDIPNPVDLALSMVPAAIPAAQLFQGISQQAIMAAPTMGNPLKDVITVALNPIRDVVPAPLAPVISSIGSAWSRMWS
ncbi:hypothetical protein JMJ35_004255 [Cladonia borealis]|uniref:Uncharacterized protein n=1 Tax=Cladonia borealis TaxID=184061 RepID=A0AA39V5Z4_9LECA|nr:hypothetical protein JMJ35_004255 [Cladonia borealis]